MRRLPKRLAERLWFGLAGAAIMAAVAGTTAYVTAPDPPAMRIAPEPVMPSPTLTAEPLRPGQPDDARKAQVPELRRRLLREKVGLTEEKAAWVETVYRDGIPNRKAERRRVREARQRLGRLIRTNSHDQQAYADALDELIAAEESLAGMHRKQIEQVREKLTPEESAKLLRGLEKLQRVMRRQGHGAAPGGQPGERMPRRRPGLRGR